TTSQYVTTLDVKDNTVYIGGAFTMVGGLPRTHLAAVDAGTGSLLTWAPDVAGTGIDKLVASGNAVYVVGDFPKSIGGAYRPYRIAGLDATTGLATTWNPEFKNGSALDVTANDYTLFIAGTFDSVGIQSQHGIVSFDLATTSQKSWNPDITSGEGGYYVYTVTASTRRLYVAGDFSGVGNEYRGQYAEYDLCSPVGALALNGSTLTAPAGTSYQWYLDGKAIDGATAQTLDINLLENGIYAVEVTSSGCLERSDDFAYLITSNESTAQDGIILYPNPAAEELIIILPEAQTATFSMTDIMGRTIKTTTGFETNNRINVSDLKAGPYLVKVRYGNKESVKKIIKK
ncbi:MAG TPA: T9SS type A sorting domain-containing protein, partial [Ohtaekwangia sp.]|uniref:T9SS type A sorting domain-containing protein n=1 Tax=Ohtaekwangia sp. TaxID=2066019 RepID=UPI002F91D6CA